MEAYVSIPSDIFKLILDYAYSGSCQITSENVQFLLLYADQYEVIGVIQLCCQYILGTTLLHEFPFCSKPHHFLDHLHPNNCLGILKFGKQYFCSDLEEKGRLFVRHNFEQVLRDSKEFEELNIVDLTEILSDDELNVRSEEVVFKAIEKWIGTDLVGRKAYLPDLLKCVRLGMLTQEFITTMMTWPPIIEDEVGVRCLITLEKVFGEKVLRILRELLFLWSTSSSLCLLNIGF